MVTYIQATFPHLKPSLTTDLSLRYPRYKLGNGNDNRNVCSANSAIFKGTEQWYKHTLKQIRDLRTYWQL